MNSPESMDDGASTEGEPGSPAMDWYNDHGPEAAVGTVDDETMGRLSEIDRKILASVIMSVDITEVYSPARVNELAAKFWTTARAIS